MTRKTVSMHRWQVGDVEIVRIEDSSFDVPAGRQVAAWMVPHFATAPDLVAVSFSAIAVRAGDLRVVIDPWLADDNPRGRLDAARHVAGLCDQFSDAGFDPSDIDVVVNSHFDGVGWNTRPDERGGWVPTFPHARTLYPADELASIGRGDFGTDAEPLDVLIDGALLEGIELPHALTPEVRLVAAPGHNAGHAAVRIESGGDLAIVPGHLILSPFQVDDPGGDAVPEPDPATATTSRRSMLDELADRNGLLITTLLGGPGGGRVHSDSGRGGYHLEVLS